MAGSDQIPTNRRKSCFFAGFFVKIAQAGVGRIPEKPEAVADLEIQPTPQRRYATRTQIALQKQVALDTAGAIEIGANRQGAPIREGKFSQRNSFPVWTVHIFLGSMLFYVGN
jgi:hypothetical protein